MKPAMVWLLYALYSLTMIGLSFVTTGRERNADEFWNGRKDIHWLSLSMSLTAGWLMLGWIGFGMGQIYVLGATGLWILPLPWLVLCVLIVLFVRLYRKVPNYSIADAFESKYGPAARVMIGVFSLLVFTSWTGAELFMLKSLAGPAMGVGEGRGWIVLLAAVAPAMIYIYRGGFRAVVNTDVAQFLMMVVFMIVLLGFAFKQAGAAVQGQSLLDALRAARPPALAADAPALGLFNMGLVFPLALLIGYLPGWAIEQDLWLRIQAARDLRDARRSVWSNLVLVGLFVIVIPSIIALLALVIFPPEGGAEAAAVGGAGSGAIGIIPALMARMPAGVGYFMFLGIICCQMSTVDTFSNVAALALGNDVMGRRGEAGRRVGRIVSVVVLFLGFLYALWADRLGDIYYVSSGVLSASIAVPFFAHGWRRTGRAAIFTASLAGCAAAIFFYWLEYKVWALKPPAALSFLAPSMGYNYVGACVLVSAAALAGVSLVFPAIRKRERAEGAQAEGRQAIQAVSLK